MQKNKTRIILMLFTLVYAGQTNPLSAWNLSSVATPLRTYLQQTMDKARSHALSIFGITAIAVPALLYLTRTQAEHPQQEQNQRLYQRFFGFLDTLIHAPLNRIAAGGTSLFRAISNYVSPTLAYSVSNQAPGYQPADDNHLATVPHFNDQENLIGQPQRFQSPQDNANVTVQQLLTSMQSGNTCGYECVKNGCACVALIRGLSGQYLLTEEAAQELFGENPDGLLRQSLIRSRKRNSLKELLITRLIVQNPAPLEGETAGTITDYRIAYQRTLLPRFLEAQINTLEQTGTVTFNGETIRDYLVQAPIDNRYANNPDRTPEEIDNLYRIYVEYLHNPQNIARYINLADEIRWTREDLDNAIQNLNATREAAQRIPTNGEDLEIEEIKDLCRQEHARPDSAIGQAIGDVPVISLPSAEAPANGIVVNIQHAIAERRIPQNGRIYAFNLGSDPEEAGSVGHWISLILEMAQGHRRYSIIDSRNHVGLFNGPATNLIQFLEGQRPQVPHELMQAVTAQLDDYTIASKMALTRLENTIDNYQKTLGNLNGLPAELQQRIRLLRLAFPQSHRSDEKKDSAPPERSQKASCTTRAHRSGTI